MKTSVVLFGIGLLCYMVSVGARNIGEDWHEVASPSKLSFNVDKFIKENPELIPNSDHKMKGTKCECAVFDTQFPNENSSAIFIHSPFEVACNCDASGEENCRKVCVAFAEAAREYGPQMLCSTLGHYNDLMASVHSRTCGSKQWTYTGVTAPHKICCHDHQVIACKKQVENLVPNQL